MVWGRELRSLGKREWQLEGGRGGNRVSFLGKYERSGSGETAIIPRRNVDITNGARTAINRGGRKVAKGDSGVHRAD